MITPTLLDVAIITGLPPSGNTYLPTSQPSMTITYEDGKLTYKGFIGNNHDKQSDSVSDEEHMTFLWLWLSSFVFCLRSLQCPRSLLPLANMLHEGTSSASKEVPDVEKANFYPDNQGTQPISVAQTSQEAESLDRSVERFTDQVIENVADDARNPPETNIEKHNQKAQQTPELEAEKKSLPMTQKSSPARTNSTKQPIIQAPQVIIPREKEQNAL
ncbi:hypothetical protein SESBI_28640 [Sesbania bispinosa]|nr:hypothetical protein SESBI_28640 [Sesbania bispinosa]